MNQTLPSLALEDAAAMLLRIWACMFARFGDLGVEPVRHLATCNWLSAKLHRFEALVRRYAAGKLRRVTQPRVVTRDEAVERKPVRRAEFRMPRKWGWLLRSGRHHAAFHGGQIRMVLERPEIVEMLQTAPHARQMIRPLCRALGIDLDWALDKPLTPRPRKTRVMEPEDPRKRLPRGVKAWVKKQRVLEAAIAGRKALVLKWAQERRR